MYCFPTYLLIPPKAGSSLRLVLERHSTPDQAPSYTRSPYEEITNHIWADTSGTSDDDLSRKRAWRIMPAYVDALRQRAKRFEGSHNFHNFTAGAQFQDRSSYRYMKSIEVRRIYGGWTLFVDNMLDF